MGAVTGGTGAGQGLGWDLGPGRGSRAVGLPYSWGARAVALCTGPLDTPSPSPGLSLQSPPRTHSLGEAPSTAPPPRAPCVLSAGTGGVRREVGGPACFPHPSSVRAQIWDIKLHAVCSLHFLLSKYFDSEPRGNYPTFILCYRGFWAANISRSRRPLRAGRSGLRGARGISNVHCSVCH